MQTNFEVIQSLSDIELYSVALKEISNKIDLTKSMHPMQRYAASDDNRYIGLICTRRSGKTLFKVMNAIQCAYNDEIEGDIDEAIYAYVAPSRATAKKLAWGKIHLICKKHNIPYKTNSQELRVIFPNKAELWLLGVDKEPDVEKLRGMAYKKIWIDEAKDIRNFDVLLDDVIEPALADYGGKLVIGGTPGYVLAGKFYEITKNEDKIGEKHWNNGKWSIYQWGMRDNRYFPLWRTKRNWRLEVEKLLTSIREYNNWTEDNVTYQREWLGKWVTDTERIMFNLTEENYYD